MSQVKKGKGNSLIVQGTVLAVASIIVRIIGFVYRIPLVNIIGDTGMGYYGAAFEIYAYLLIVSSYGLPGAISKLVSAEIAVKKYKEAHKIFRSALVLGSIIGVLASLFLWFGAGIIAESIKSPASIYAIKALAPAILIFSIMAVYRGYFQGMNTMVPTAFSQIIEQVLNAIFSIIMAYLLVSKGLEYGAAGGTMGTGIGAFFGLILLMAIYAMAKRLIKRNLKKDSHKYRKRSLVSYWKVIVFTAVPMVIGTAAYQAAALADLFMFQNALFSWGYASENIALMYGVLSGKFRIITTLPISIASALAVASVPSITTSVVQNDIDSVNRKIDMALKTVLLISFPSFIGIHILARPITQLLFGMENLDLAVELLKLGSITVVLFGITTITIGVLQGLGKFSVPVISSTVALIIKIVLNYILLYVYDTNLYGAIISTIVFAFITVAINMIYIYKTIPLKISIKKVYIIPLISSLIMGVVSYFLYEGLFIVIKSNAVSTIITILVAMFIYFIGIFKMGGMNKNEISRLPLGSKLVKLLEILKIV